MQMNLVIFQMIFMLIYENSQLFLNNANEFSYFSNDIYANL